MSKGARSSRRFSRRKREDVPQRRSAKRRQLRRTVLIVGEGRETEPNYFRQLKQDVLARFAVEVSRGPGFSPEAVVKKALKLLEGANQRYGTPTHAAFDEVWCVFDVETYDERDSLDAAVKLAEDNGIRPCLSNPSFEVWLLAHFEKTATYFLNSDAVIAELNKKWQASFNQDYRKNDTAVYDRVRDLTQTAVENAKWVREESANHAGKPNTADCNSSTEVYRLVEHLIG